MERGGAEEERRAGRWPEALPSSSRQSMGCWTMKRKRGPMKEKFNKNRRPSAEGCSPGCQEALKGVITDGRREEFYIFRENI